MNCIEGYWENFNVIMVNEKYKIYCNTVFF